MIIVPPAAFISYSSKDRAFAVKLAEALQKYGVTIWLDVWRIRGHASAFWPEIEQGIKNSTHLIFVISPDSLNKESQVWNELAHAKVHKKIIILVMAKSVDYESLPIEITPGLYQIHDFPKLGFQEGVTRVLNALNIFQKLGSKNMATQSKINWTKWGVIAAFLTIFATLAVPFIENMLDDSDQHTQIVPSVTPTITPTETVLAATESPTPTETATHTPTYTVTATLTETVANPSTSTYTALPTETIAPSATSIPSNTLIPMAAYPCVAAISPNSSASVLNIVRQYANPNAQVVASVRRGEQVTVIDISAGAEKHYQIQSNGRTVGWVSGEYLVLSPECP